MTDSYEMKKVHDWRDRGRSWQTIAENLRRSTHDVRRRYDRSYNEYSPPAKEAVSKPKTPIRARADDAKSKSELAVMAVFYMADDWVELKALHSRQRDALCRVKSKYGTHVIESFRGKGSRLTLAGRELYERTVQL